MTDEELIARLRVDEPMCEEHFTANLAADRIEALTKERDQWISHAKTAIWSDSEELKETGRKLEKAVKLIDLAVELARWDRAPKLRDDMIDFTTEIKSHSDEFATQKGESHE